MIVRRYDESEKQLRKTVELDPNFQVGYFSLANTLQMQGRYAESVEAYARAREIAGNAVEAAESIIQTPAVKSSSLPYAQ